MPRRHPDRSVFEAKRVIIEEVFGPHPESVFYERQLQVQLEKRFFHWITGYALHELCQEGAIRTERLPLLGQTRIRFYWSNTLRSWKRTANHIVKLVARYSVPEFAIAIGVHGETMFDAALPKVGFVPKAWNVRTYGGRSTERLKNLDRVAERDGIEYGVEIKNTLDYIGRDEFHEKLLICKDLALRPLFICRALPKSYVMEVIRAGGFALIFDWRLYLHGYKSFAEEVRAELGLRVDSPARIADGTLDRLVGIHTRIRDRVGAWSQEPVWPEEAGGEESEEEDWVDGEERGMQI